MYGAKFSRCTIFAEWGFQKFRRKRENYAPQKCGANGNLFSNFDGEINLSFYSVLCNYGIYFVCLSYFDVEE